MKENTKVLLSELLKGLPAVMTRADIPKFFGSVISPNYVANLDSAQKGPRRILSQNSRGKAMYRTEDFVRWLFDRMDYEYD